MNINGLKQNVIMVIIGAIVLLLAIEPGRALAQKAEEAPEANKPAQAGEQAPDTKKQEQPAGARVMVDATGWVTRLIRLKYADPNAVTNNLNRLYKDRIYVDSAQGMHAIIVRASPEMMTSIEALLKDMDQSPWDIAGFRKPAIKWRNIEYTAYILKTSDEAASDEKLPDQVQPAIKQLRAVLGIKSFQMIDNIILRTQEGDSASASGICIYPSTVPSSPGDKMQAFYNLSIKTGAQMDIGSRKVIVNNIGLNIRVPLKTASEPISYSSVGTESSLELNEGQLAVVGKIGIGSAKSNAMVLIISARIID